MLELFLSRKIKRNNDNYPNIKLEKIVVIPIDENVDNNFYGKRKQKSPYNNGNIGKEYFLEICDKV